MAIDQPQERLAYLAFAILLPDQITGDPDLDEQADAYLRLLAHIDGVWDELASDIRNTLDTVRKDITDPAENNPEFIRDRLLSVIADETLIEAARRAGVIEPVLTDDDRALRRAGGRYFLGVHTDEDRALAARWITSQGGTIAMEDGTFAPYEGQYVIDRYLLPDTFDEDAFKEAVIQLFADRGIGIQDPIDRGHQAYVSGKLILESYFSPDSPGFNDTFSDFYNLGYEVVETLGDTRRITREVYAAVANQIADIKGGAPARQEVAAITDEVLLLGPIDDNFRAKVQTAHADYVARTPIYDSLELPDIVTDATAKAEVEPGNIRAVAMIYAVGHLEPLFDACDAAARDWSSGEIPIQEGAGRLFDSYVWNARDRLDPAARQIQVDRIADLDQHLLRFCSATSERDRSQYLSEYLVGDQPRTSAQPRDAAVRKAARDLLAYASLRGWAYTQFAAKRLANHIRECTEIIESYEVQKAYGVDGPWPAVERIHMMTTGTVPNIAKERTLASTGKEILDMLANKAIDIAASLAKDPLFPADVTSTDRSIFSLEEYEDLIVLVENWLAANGVNDPQRYAASQIVDNGGVPSLPDFGGTGGFGGGGFDANSARDQLMQLVSGGQMPTAGQIDQLFNINLN